MTGRKKAPSPPAIEWAGWYAIDRGLFWAAWWTGVPSADPWRTPDATGHGPPEDAERRIRREKGPGAYVKQIGEEWAASARREAEGQAPRPKAPKAKRARRVHESTKDSKRTATDHDAQQARLYWILHDHFAAAGGPLPDWRAWGLSVQPPRPPNIPPPPPHQKRRVFVVMAATAPASFAALGLRQDASPEDVRRAYRKIVATRRLHPDHGGDVGAFREITAHRDLALAAAERRGAFH